MGDLAGPVKTSVLCLLLLHIVDGRCCDLFLRQGWCEGKVGFPSEMAGWMRALTLQVRGQLWMEARKRGKWFRGGLGQRNSQGSVEIFFFSLDAMTSHILVVTVLRIHCQCRDIQEHRFDPGLGRWRKTWQPLQFSCLENAVDGGGWRLLGPVVLKESDPPGKCCLRSVGTQCTQGEEEEGDNGSKLQIWKGQRSLETWDGLAINLWGCYIESEKPGEDCWRDFP